MRAVDIKAKGNVVRVFLSAAEDLEPVWGDDWNDRGCTDGVYSEYVDGYKDLVFDFSKTVYTCDEYIDDYKACKEDMKQGTFPMFLVMDNDDEWGGFEKRMASKNAYKVYFGDEFEPDAIYEPKEDDDRWARGEWMYK